MIDFRTPGGGQSRNMPKPIPISFGEYSPTRKDTHLPEVESPPLAPNFNLSCAGLLARGDNIVHTRTGMTLGGKGKTNPLWSGEGLDLTLFIWALTRMKSPKFGGADYPKEQHGAISWGVLRETMQTPDCIIARMAEDMVEMQANHEQITLPALLITGWTHCQLEAFVEKAKSFALATGMVQP